MLIAKPAVFFIILILSAYYDLKKMIVPDFITYPGIILGFAFVFLNEKSLWLSYLIGGAGGFFIAFLISLIGKRAFKKEALGGGDVKLIALIGLFVGYAGLLLCFILSSITGILSTYIIYKDLTRTIPYAFYLSISGMIIYIFIYFYLA